MKALVTVALVMFWLAGAVGTAHQQHSIQPPKRRAVIAPPAPLTDLPPDADRIAPQRLEIVRRIHAAAGGPEPRRETITRTVDRIHLSSGGREWLFQRNVRDPRRVSGTLVDHAARAVVFHDESDLRNRIGMNGWADALSLGFTPGVEVERTADGVDAALLRSPAERFPEYKVVDLAEWLEGS